MQFPFQRQLEMFLAEKVTKGTKLHPPIHPGAATFTLAVVAMSLLAIFVALLFTTVPDPVYVTEFHALSPDINVEKTLSFCSTWSELNAYDRSIGRFVGSVTGLGDFYVREAIHPNEFRQLVSTMLCAPAASIMVSSSYYNIFGAESHTEDIANVCMPPPKGSPPGTLGSGTVKEAMQSSNLYMVSSTSRVDSFCQQQLGVARAAYGEMREASVDPVLVGMQCHNWGPTPAPSGRVVPMLIDELFFAWPLATERGILKTEVHRPCIDSDQAMLLFKEVWSTLGLNFSDSMEAASGPGLFMNASTSVHMQRWPHVGWRIHFVQGPYFDPRMSKIFGYGSLPGMDQNDTSVEYLSNTSVASRYVRQVLGKSFMLERSRSVCKNQTYPLELVREFSDESAFEDMLALYRQANFSYECSRKVEPSHMSRLVHIWPLLSLFYTFLAIYATRLLYPFIYSVGRALFSLSDRKHIHLQSSKGWEATSSNEDSAGEARLNCIEEQLQTLSKTWEETWSDLRVQMREVDARARSREPDMNMTTSGGGATPVQKNTPDLFALLGLPQDKVDDLGRRLERIERNQIWPAPEEFAGPTSEP